MLFCILFIGVLLNLLNFKFNLQIYERGKEMDFTAEAIKPITDAISGGMALLIPVGLGVMGTFVGISIIKRVIFSFL